MRLISPAQAPSAPGVLQASTVSTVMRRTSSSLAAPPALQRPWETVASTDRYVPLPYVSHPTSLAVGECSFTEVEGGRVRYDAHARPDGQRVQAHRSRTLGLGLAAVEAPSIFSSLRIFHPRPGQAKIKN